VGREKKKIFGFEETRFALMNKTFEHQTHHRGQTTILYPPAGNKTSAGKIYFKNFQPDIYNNKSPCRSKGFCYMQGLPRF
jgi:hypothetical protein